MRTRHGARRATCTGQCVGIGTTPSRAQPSPERLAPTLVIHAVLATPRLAPSRTFRVVLGYGRRLGQSGRRLPLRRVSCATPLRRLLAVRPRADDHPSGPGTAHGRRSFSTRASRSARASRCRLSRSDRGPILIAERNTHHYTPMSSRSAAPDSARYTHPSEIDAGPRIHTTPSPHTTRRAPRAPSGSLALIPERRRSHFRAPCMKGAHKL